MSNTITTIPITVCLAEIEKKVKAQGGWRTTNDLQREFLEKAYASDCLDRSKLTAKELSYEVSHEAEVINAFLASKNFQIKLDPFTDPTDFGVASVLDVSVEWKVPGKKTSFTIKDEQFPAVSMKEDDISIYKGSHGAPVVRIETKSGDVVSLSMVGKELSGFALKEMAASFTQCKTPSFDFAGIKIPMIHIDQEEDISFFKDMSIDGTDGLGEAIIKQALQQTRFRLNEKGARAESAAVMGVMRCTSFQRPNPELVFDRPFVISISRPGMVSPLFTAYVTEKDWKDPGSLA
jgi:hypothetical protein